jgi:hypothetical protein
VNPEELLAVPFNLYLAAAETAEPALDAAIPGGWALLGQLGSDEYDEDGITVTHEQNIEYFRGLGSTIPIKAFRSTEGLTIGLTVRDVSMETYAKILDDASIAEDSNGGQSVAMYRGYQVQDYALVLRSADGPYGEGSPMQYWVPRVVQSGNPAVVHKKGTPAGLALVFTAIKPVGGVISSADSLGIVRAIGPDGS